MAWDKETGWLDVENGWFDRDHSEEYWRGVWDTFVFLRETKEGDFFHTTLAYEAGQLLPDEYTEPDL